MEEVRCINKTKRGVDMSETLALVSHNNEAIRSEFDDLETWLKRYPKNTARVYRKDIEDFIGWCKRVVVIPGRRGGRSLQVAMAWVEALQTKLSTATVARKVSAIRSYYDFLCSIGAISTNPFSYLNAPSVHNKQRDILDRNDIDLMLQKVDCQRDRCIILLLSELGLRRHEVAQLKQNSLGKLADGRTIIKFVGKGNKDRDIPISRSLLAEIDKYRGVAQHNDRPLFLNKNGSGISSDGIYEIVRKYAHLARINKEITPHSFRHFVTTDAYLATGDATKVMTITGHKHVSTVQRYIHLNEVNTITEIQERRGIK